VPRRCNIEALRGEVEARGGHIEVQTECVGARRAKLHARADHIDSRADHLDARADHIDSRADHIDTRADRIDSSATHLDRRAGSRHTFAGDIDARGAGVDAPAEFGHAPSANIDRSPTVGDSPRRNIDALREEALAQCGADDRSADRIDVFPVEVAYRRRRGDPPRDVIGSFADETDASASEIDASWDTVDAFARQVNASWARGSASHRCALSYLGRPSVPCIMSAVLALELPMTVTAKLSQAFYDRLGHQVADEMVDWFNQVDAAYRSDLRELNDLNFARFDAKMDKRFLESAAALEQRLSEFARGIEQQIARLALDLKSLEVTLMRQQVVQMRWMIGMWLAVFLAVIGLWVRR
jgi:hypothetical protein